MVRALQKKFIVSAMIAVTLVMALFLMAVNVSNYLSVRRDTERSMLLISDKYGLGIPGNRPGPGPGADDGGSDGSAQGELPEDLKDSPRGDLPELPGAFRAGFLRGGEDLSLEQYFAVRVSAEGEVLYTDLAHVASVDAETAREMADAAGESGEDRGRVNGYIFRKSTDAASGSATYTFLDARQQTRSVLRTLVLTLLVGGVSWILVLLLVIFLSRRAIMPIARNIERQKQFVTDAGHEIKTPLAIIQANADVLELHMGGNKWIDNIRSQTKRLGSLTQNLLLLSRMEEGAAAEAPAEEFDAAAVLMETVDQYREVAESRGVRLTCETSEGKMPVRLQRDAYIRLLNILLENASKYVRDKGFISVILEKSDGGGRSRGSEKGISLRVTNDCDTPPEGDPERLFERFYRSDKARTQKTGGSGIGLSVARAIAESCGGSIRAVLEKDPDTGREDRICFRLILPSGRKQ